MQFKLTFGSAVALLSAMSNLSYSTAASIPVELEKRQRIPGAINIGLDPGSGSPGQYQYVIWINGEDPCHNKATMDVRQPDSPCNHRFTAPNADFQYSMQGCGSDNLYITRNGQDNVGSCHYAPGKQACAAGQGYDGEWQCVLNDPTK
jgi:hypothetical protein